MGCCLIGALVCLLALVNCVTVTESSPNGPASGSASITIVGIAFLATDSTPTIKINDLFCSTSQWISTTAAICATPSVTSTRVYLAIDLKSGATSHTLTAFTFDAPVATVHELWNAPTSGRASLTVHGVNYGAVDASPSANVGSTLCGTTMWLTGTSVVCSVASGSSATLTASSLEFGGLLGTSVYAFSYDAPVITLSLPRNTALTGGSLSFEGFNFGTQNTCLSASLGSTVCSTTRWVSTTSVTCALSSGSSLSLRNGVDAHSLLGTQTVVITYDSPVITLELTPNAPTTRASVTVDGTSFATHNYSMTGSFGSTVCATTAWLSVSSLVCAPSAGSSHSLAVVVELSRLVGSRTMAFTFNAPLISYVRQSNEPTTGYASVTVEGSNFGVISPSPSLTLSSTVCSTSTWVSVSSVLCSLHSFGSSGSLMMTVMVEALQGSATQVFTFDAPTVTYAWTGNVATSGTLSVTVEGFNFRVSEASSSVTLGRTLCSTSRWISGTSLTCENIRGGSFSDLAVVVEANTVLGTSTQAFTFDAPVASARSLTNTVSSGGASLTVGGMNFGVVASSSTAFVGHTLCATSKWLSDSSLVCGVGAGTSANLAVAVQLEQLVGTVTLDFTYDSPVVTRAAKSNLPATGVGSVTVDGLGFAALDASLTASVGSSVCGTTRWISVSSVVCSLSGGSSHTLAATVLTSAQVGTLTHAFTYDAPLSTAARPSNAPTTGIASITVEGVNFGNFEASLSATLGSTLCSTSRWLSPTSVVCLVVPGSSLELSAVVAVDQLWGTAVQEFTYDAPTVTLLKPSNAPSTGSASVTVEGSDFLVAAASPSATLGSTLCGTTRWVSSSALVCQAPAGSSSVLTAVVRADSVLGTVTHSWTFDAPVITMNSFNSVSSSLTSLTVDGINFGVNTFSSSVYVGSTLCGTTTWLSASSVVCGAPAGTSLLLSVAVQLGSLLGTRSMALTYDAPVVTMELRPNTPTTGSASLTVGGGNFGIIDPSASVVLGSTLCSTTKWLSSSSIVCSSPPASSQALTSMVLVNALGATHATAITFNAPVATGFPLPNGPTTGLFSVTVDGTNFGVTATSPSTTVGSTLCSTTRWLSSSSVVCAMLHGGSEMLTAVLSLGSELGTSTMAFTFDAPAVTLSAIHNGPTSGAKSLTVQGVNLGSFDSSPSASIARSVCATAAWSSASSVICSFGGGSSYGLDVIVNVDALVGTAATVFSYDSPTVTSVSQFNGPKSGTASVTVDGANFGVLPTSVSATVGNSLCSTSRWVSHTSVVCALLEGKETVKRLVLEADALVGTLTRAFTFDAPSFTCSVLNTPATGGTSLTFRGTNFGFTDATVTVSIGVSLCQTTQWVSASSLTCLSPPGELGAQDIRVQVLLIGSRAAAFTFDSVILSAVTPINSPSTAGLSMTLRGMNFVPRDSTPTTIIGSTTSATSVWISSTMVRAYQPLGGGQQLEAKLTVLNAMSGTAQTAFTVDAPVLTIVTPTNAPSSGAPLSVMGTNFALKDVSPSITLGPSLCLTNSWLSTTAFSCMRTGVLHRHIAISEVRRVVGTAVIMFSFNAPVVSAISTVNSPTSGGPITIRGLEYGSVDYSISAVVGATLCLTTSWISTTTTRCVVNHGSQRLLRANVHLDFLVATLNKVFSYDAPIVTSTSPSNGPTFGSTLVTIYGLNFGSGDPSDALQTFFDENMAVDALYPGGVLAVTHERLVSLSAASTADRSGQPAKAVRVQVAGLSSTLLAAFTYHLLIQVTSVNPLRGPASGGTLITMAGTNMRHEWAESTVVTVGDSVCTDLALHSATSATCRVPPGVGTHNVIAMTATTDVAVVRAECGFGFEYYSPEINSLVPSVNAFVRGDTLTIVGKNFGDGPDPTLLVDLHGSAGIARCETVTWVSDTMLLCIFADFVPGLSHIEVFVANQRARIAVQQAVGAQQETGGASQAKFYGFCQEQSNVFCIPCVQRQCFKHQSLLYPNKPRMSWASCGETALAVCNYSSEL